jgi:hypothetical protein
MRGIAAQRRRRIPGTWLYLGLTLVSALATHLIFDAIDDGPAAIGTRPVHLLYLAVVAVALLFAWADFARGDGADLRRRLALARAAVRSNRPVPFIAAILLQAALAIGTVLLEPQAFGPANLILAFSAALIALCVGAVASRHVERRIIGLMYRVLLSPHTHAKPHRTAEDVVVRAFTEQPFLLFVPNRPPPSAVGPFSPT